MNHYIFFDKLLDLISKTFSKYLYDIEKEIVHYTNLSGLYGIIGTKKIWATNAYFLNDTSEYIYSINKFKETLQKQNLKIKHKRFKYFSESILTYLEINNHFPPIYTISFSENPDSLGQWRGYGELNRAFNLKFSSSKLWALSGGDVYMLKVVYDELVQNQLIIEIIKNSFNYYTAIKSSDSKKIGLFMNHLSFILNLFLPIIKNPHFKEEAEVRLIINLGYQGENPRFNVQHRIGKHSLIPYVEYSLMPNPSFNISYTDIPALTGITIGPNAYPELAIGSIVSYLQNHKEYNLNAIKITQSKIPFRL
ncbi:DUF2971 domain-containing protein [Leptospira paudalimensis]|uniref:DUF2971 domain-containing protein n=1 Tax=Leptospira paudalimensis TaxID=2950024 RepID=A0ABT3M561_9LEPT|nr:DUF2971 domain-containing protein [Leptospira paudalimensis]MCW7503529.1 DUF2971 domain-containing protein [Leptospira paudalimensis]